MTILYLDCFSGISGNMLLGALLDAGGDAGHLQSELRKLPLPGWQLHIERRLCHGISGTYVQVLDEQGRPWEEAGGTSGHGVHGLAAQSSPGHQPVMMRVFGHSHAHGCGNNGHSHNNSAADCGHALSSEDGAANSPLREAAHNHNHTSFRQIRTMLTESALPGRVKETAMAVFTALAQAEGHVHGRPADDVHFHEVGAVDSIIDIVGAAVLLHQLGVEKVLCSPLPTGSGYVRCAHGLLPVPAPATALLLQGVPLRPSPVQAELTTPTGAALVRVLARGFGPLPAGTYRAVGYGLGSREIGQPNALRVFLYERLVEGNGTAGWQPAAARGDGLSPEAEGEDGNADNSPCGGIAVEEIAVLTTHLDDCPPEWYSTLFDLLLAAGALDVAVTPAQMKKNRPGHALTVLCPPARSHELALLILQHSPALGVRCRLESRYVLPRREEKIATPLGEVAVKISYGPDGSAWHIKPAADDMKALVLQHGLSVEQVQRLVWRCLGDVALS